MSKVVFAAILAMACYSAYKAVALAAERRRESRVRARARTRVEPRDLGSLREAENGIYVPDDHRS